MRSPVVTEFMTVTYRVGYMRLAAFTNLFIHIFDLFLIIWYSQFIVYGQMKEYNIVKHTHTHVIIVSNLNLAF